MIAAELIRPVRCSESPDAHPGERVYQLDYPCRDTTGKTWPAGTRFVAEVGASANRPLHVRITKLPGATDDPR